MDQMLTRAHTSVDELKGCSALEATVCSDERGFGLVEMLTALTVLTFGLLTVGQLLSLVQTASAGARFRTGAASAAQTQMEFLAVRRRHDPSDAQLRFGRHGPRRVEVINPGDGSVLNRFDLSWEVSAASPPIPGIVMVVVAVVPVLQDGTVNVRPGMNGVLKMATLLSAEPRTTGGAGAAGGE